MFLAADVLQRLQVLLRGVERRLGLRVGDLRFVDQFFASAPSLNSCWRLSSSFFAASIASRAAATSVCAFVTCSGTPAAVVER